MNANERLNRGLEGWDYINNPANGIRYDVEPYTNLNEKVMAAIGEGWKISLTTTRNKFTIKVTFIPDYSGNRDGSVTSRTDCVTASAYIHAESDVHTNYINVNKFCGTTGWEGCNKHTITIDNDTDLKKLHKKIERMFDNFKVTADLRGDNCVFFENKVKAMLADFDPAIVEINGQDKIFKVGEGHMLAVVKSYSDNERYTIDLPSMAEDEMLAVLEGVKRMTLLRRMKEV